MFDLETMDNPLANDAGYNEKDVLGRLYFAINKRWYAVVVKRFWANGEPCWTAYKPAKHGLSWEKIPCFSRSEEARFPKSVAKVASGFCDNFKPKPIMR